VVGVDFDNTVVCYDAVFHRAAVAGGLVPPHLLPSKGAVRDYLRAAGREPEWTALQGRVYGSMAGALPYPGVLPFFAASSHWGAQVSIISHKTRFPVIGPRVDLREAAMGWLERTGFLDPAIAGLPRERVFFEPTVESKLDRIRAQGCTHFVDDLPEFLAEGRFPPGVTRILFDPNGRCSAAGPFLRFETWPALTDYLFGEREIA